jgi:hypothetical protein
VVVLAVAGLLVFGNPTARVTSAAAATVKELSVLPNLMKLSDAGKVLSQEELRQDISLEIKDVDADELGMECYVVGGYVRDIFLQRPSTDIDVVVVGKGIEMARAFSKKLGRRAHLAVYANFGTAQVKYGEHEIEFVGARREGGDMPGGNQGAPGGQGNYRSGSNGGSGNYGNGGYGNGNGSYGRPAPQQQGGYAPAGNMPPMPQEAFNPDAGEDDIPF